MENNTLDITSKIEIIKQQKLNQKKMVKTVTANLNCEVVKPETIKIINPDQELKDDK